MCLIRSNVDRWLKLRQQKSTVIYTFLHQFISQVCEAALLHDLRRDGGVHAEGQRTSSELLIEEWNLLSLAFKNAVGSRRAAWRVITSTEQKEKFKGKEELVLHAREYVAKVEGELQKIRDGILALMDKELIPSPGTDELKVLYYKMKSDYHRYLAEFATSDAMGKAALSACVEDALDACVEANQIAEKDWVVNHPVRLARH